MKAAIVLSGGGSRADFQVGAAKYVYKRGVRPIVITASSGGAPIAAKLAEGVQPEAVEWLWTSMNSSDEVYRWQPWLTTLDGKIRAFLVVNIGSFIAGLAINLAVSEIGQAMGVPAAFFAASSLVSLIQLGIDIGVIAQAVNQMHRATSIFDPSPLRQKLYGGTQTWGTLPVSAFRHALTRLPNGRLCAVVVDNSPNGTHSITQVPGSQGYWNTSATEVGSGFEGYGIAITTLSDGSIHLVVIGADLGVYWATTQDPDTGWSPLLKIAGVNANLPARLCLQEESSGNFLVFVVGQDEKIHSARWIKGAGWQSWDTLPDPPAKLRHIRVARQNVGPSLDVFGVMITGEIHHIMQGSLGAPFTNWIRIGYQDDSVGSNISVAADTTGLLHAAIVGNDGRVYYARDFERGLWSNWTALPQLSVLAAGPVVLVPTARGAFEVFAVGSDSTLYHSWQLYPSGEWHDWIPFPGGSCAQGFDSVVALEDGTGVIRVLVVENGQLFATAQSGPWVDPNVVGGSGIALRLALSNLMDPAGRFSGESRYATEMGTFADVLEPGDFDLREAVMAATALPGIFPPVQLLSTTYIDGGLRDQLPVIQAIDLGAEVVFAIVAGEGKVDPVAPTAFDDWPILATVNRALTGIMPDAIVESHLSPPVPYPVPFHVIRSTTHIHDELAVDPGLSRIAIAYGELRACDALDGERPMPLNDHPQQALLDNSNRIVQLRRSIWELEHLVAGRRDPNYAAARAIRGEPSLTLVPDPQVLNQVRWLKLQLKALIDARWVLSRYVPAEADHWWQDWEAHPWSPFTDTPWDRFDFGGNVCPAWGSLLAPDGTVIFEQGSSDYWIVFGAARFLAPQSAGARMFPSGSLVFDRTKPKDGTLVREVDWNQADAGVYFGGMLFRLPRGAAQPWPGTTGIVNILPTAGTASTYMGPPADGTLLTEDGSTIVVCYGGAKFVIPADTDVFYGIGALSTRVRFVPIGSLNNISTTPVDGTILQELGTSEVYVLQSGVRYRVMDADSFFQHGIFEPLIRLVPPMALSLFPDGGPLNFDLGS